MVCAIGIDDYAKRWRTRGGLNFVQFYLCALELKQTLISLLFQAIRR